MKTSKEIFGEREKCPVCGHKQLFLWECPHCLVKYRMCRDCLWVGDDEPMTDAELQEKWNELNGDAVWGMTFEEFQKMTHDGIEQFAKENPDFKKWIGR